MQPITCSVLDAAKALSVSRGTIYNWMNEGRIETVRVGRRRLVKIDSLKRLAGVA